MYQAQQNEFLKSTDPLFRPVGLQTAPDGTMYITDMYHGIIQEGQWTQPGTYLRARIEQYQLDKVIGLGRIWRLSHESMPRDTTQPRMFDETSAQVMAHLAHENGWWRDTAQQVLVIRQDTSVAPALRAMARSHAKPRSRGCTRCGRSRASVRSTPRWCATLMTRPEPAHARAGAARERIALQGRRQVVRRRLQAPGGDADADVAAHALLTLQRAQSARRRGDRCGRLRPMNKAAGVALVAQRNSRAPGRHGCRRQQHGEPHRGRDGAPRTRGMTVYGQLVFGVPRSNTGLGTPAGDGQTIAPALGRQSSGDQHPEYVIKTLLTA